MSVAAILAAYTLLLAVVSGRLLARANWPQRAPRCGIAAWQALSASALLGAAGAGLALVVPSVRVSAGLSGLLRECVMALRAQYRTPGGALSVTVGASIALVVIAGAVTAVTRELLIAGAARRQHRKVLSMAGRRWEAPVFSGGRCARAVSVVVYHETRVAYCLPGRGGRIVLSSAALAALDPTELEAVLAHERAHLAGRHDLVLAASLGLARVFWFVPLFRLAREQTVVLIEMLADDAAAGQGESLTVVSALLTLARTSGPAGLSARAGVPAAALGATETATGTRVRRLLASPAPVRRPSRALVGVMSLLVILTPLVVLVAPALAFANTTYCPA